jgi:hypothetical protein
MDKIDVLKSINFGGRTAEEEAGNLRRIFVETEQWRGVNQGDIDVVYGPKGSGKSAIYTLLQEQTSVSIKLSRIIVSAENPRGATAFTDLETDPPATEREFPIDCRSLWKAGFSLASKQGLLAPEHATRRLTAPSKPGQTNLHIFQLA